MDAVKVGLRGELFPEVVLRHFAEWHREAMSFLPGPSGSTAGLSTGALAPMVDLFTP